MNIPRLALFTTVYPEGERYLSDFFQSVFSQTDKKIDLWIGLDRIEEFEVYEYLSKNIPVSFIERKKNESNISLRERAIKELIEKYPGIIFVDSDDILASSRVSAARSSLAKYDVYGCAMKIIDENGADLKITFQIPKSIDILSLLPRFNIFGMSNTAYSSEMILQCLPFPKDCILLDWFVATRAWGQDARMYFDPVQRMSYRQHATNTARVIPPFTQEQILKSTNLVLQHYSLVLNNIPELPDSKRILIENAQKYVDSFNNSIRQSPMIFHEYLGRLNALPPNHIWWSSVAHPDLETVWKN
jgi:hypothetical protein